MLRLVNIVELDKEYQIELADLSLSKSDFKINLDKNLMSINNEKRSESSESQELKNSIKGSLVIILL